MLVTLLVTLQEQPSLPHSLLGQNFDRSIQLMKTYAPPSTNLFAERLADN